MWLPWPEVCVYFWTMRVGTRQYNLTTIRFQILVSGHTCPLVVFLLYGSQKYLYDSHIFYQNLAKFTLKFPCQKQSHYRNFGLCDWSIVPILAVLCWYSEISDVSQGRVEWLVVCYINPDGDSSSAQWAEATAQPHCLGGPSWCHGLNTFLTELIHNLWGDYCACD